MTEQELIDYRATYGEYPDWWYEQQAESDAEQSRHSHYAFTIGEIAYHCGLDLTDNVYQPSDARCTDWAKGWQHAQDGHMTMVLNEAEKLAQENLNP